MRSWTVSVSVALALLLAGCTRSQTQPTDPAPAARSAPGEAGEEPSPAAPPDDSRASEREAMVREQIEARGVSDPAVLKAMRTVPRHRFVPPEVRHEAYADDPLPIGLDVTISQPYIVALMTELAGVQRGDTVLEVGTGSGYQAAVLAELGATVYSIEIIKAHADAAAALLKELGHTNVHVRHGDGYAGWPEHAPFDAIIVTAAPPRIPPPLKEQLAVGGHLVIPVGDFVQELLVITRTPDGFEERTEIGVRFVPMTGEAQKQGE